MLQHRTDSDKNLKIDNSRRHAIRNLRAKVRALLPQQYCPKHEHRNKMLLKYENKTVGKLTSSQSQHIFTKSVMRNKIFQKLSKKQIQQINENKHYFLGNDACINVYEIYVKEHYPQLIEKQWKIPEVTKDFFFPDSFLAENIGRNNSQMNKNSSSKESFPNRKASLSKSILEKHTQIQILQDKRQSITNKSRQKQLRNRKMAIDQELKIKRQINSVHLNRQISSALSRRQQLISQKLKSIKRPSPYIFHKGSQDEVGKFVSHDIANITQKLRRICLMNKRSVKK